MVEKITIPKGPYKTKEEFEEVFNAWMYKQLRTAAYSQVREKARRRAYSLLRKNHSEEYYTHLEEQTKILWKVYEMKRKGG